MKKAIILGIMAFFAVGMIQNVNAQTQETSQTQQTQLKNKLQTTGANVQNATQTAPSRPRRINDRQLPYQPQNTSTSRQIKPGQDLKGDARVNAMNGRTGNRVSAQTSTQENPAQKPPVNSQSVQKSEKPEKAGNQSNDNKKDYEKNRPGNKAKN